MASHKVAIWLHHLLLGGSCSLFTLLLINSYFLWHGYWKKHHYKGETILEQHLIAHAKFVEEVWKLYNFPPSKYFHHFTQMKGPFLYLTPKILDSEGVSASSFYYPMVCWRTLGLQAKIYKHILYLWYPAKSSTHEKIHATKKRPYVKIYSAPWLRVSVSSVQC